MLKSGPLLQTEDDGSAAPDTAFARRLNQKFGETTARRVHQAFNKMGLPAPSENEEFLNGTEGPLVFLNDLGLVIRIESKYPYDGERLDHPFVVPALASIAADLAQIELCPGGMTETDPKAVKRLDKALERYGINFWDEGARNTGRLPLRTPHFPEGIPVVIDRLAVERLSNKLAPVRRLLERAALAVAGIASPRLEAARAQETAYGPLRQSFAEAWRNNDSAQGMGHFWSLCRDKVRDGTLVAGWTVADKNPYSKSEAAALAGAAYEQRRAADKQLRAAGKTQGGLQLVGN